FAALLAQGCSWIPSVGPDYVPPTVSLPDRWRAMEERTTTAPESAFRSSWWSSFRDPVLDTLVQHAVEKNFSLEAARSRAREARLIRAQVGGAFLPQVNLGGSYARIRRNLNTVLIPGANTGVDPVTGAGAINTRDPEQDLYDASFDSSWEIDIFGGLRRQYEAAEASAEAAEESLRSAQISLVAEVVRNYFEYLSLAKRVSIADKNLHAQGESAQIVKARFDAGLSSELDLAQANAQLETTRATVPALRAAWTASTNALAVLLAENPVSVSDVLRNTKQLTAESSIVDSLPREMSVGAPSEILRLRPDVRQAERQLAASSALIGAAIGELFPKVAITGSFGYQSIESSGFLDAANRVWRIGPGISVPLFAGGRLWNEVRVQRERNTQALKSYEETVVRALAETDTAIAAFLRQHERFDALAKALVASRRALELSQDLYKQGLVDFQRVLDSERATFAAEDQLAQSENEIIASVARVYKALGYGVELQQDESSPSPQQ
ncbi:MAG: TolC family protein, partial [Deltaproteobacteria bacterium]|nr:TolC family protein [Deltaproteobacteria bacterium]